MALDLGGRTAEADRAYEWLVDLQRDDGSWHQYYVAGDDGCTRSSRTSSTPTCAPTSRPACGTAGSSPATAASSRRCGPPSRRRIDFVLDLQTAARRDPLGPPRRRHAVELRPAHRLVVDLPQPPLRHRHRPSCSATSAPTGSSSAARLARVDPRRSPRRSPPSTAGPWTGTTRCSAAWCSASRPGAASTSAATPSSWTAGACAACPTGRGSRWPRPASAPWRTSPSATARRPTTLFGWAQQFRHDEDGRYWTGTVFPDEARFPGGERSTYTAAASSWPPTPSPAHPRQRPLRRDRGRPAPAHGPPRRTCRNQPSAIVLDPQRESEDPTGRAGAPVSRRAGVEAPTTDHQAPPSPRPCPVASGGGGLRRLPTALTSSKRPLARAAGR